MLNNRFKADYHTPRKDDGYVILVGVLIMGAVAVAVANSVLLLGIGSSRTSLTQQQGYQAQSVADACAEIALQELIDDATYAGETIDPFGSGRCIISVDQSPACAPDCIIEATGEVGRITRKAKITVTVGTGGGGLLLGKGVFPISPAALSYTAAGSTGTLNVKDNAATPNQPANETLEIAAADKPIVHTNDNRVNVGDVVTLSGSAFNTPALGNVCGCDPLVPNLNYCAEIFWDVVATEQAECTLSSGSFSGCSLTIPATPAGDRYVEGKDRGTGTIGCSGARTSLKQYFFVEPKITATACSGTPRTTTINGTGFAANSTVTITWDNADTVTERNTGATGSFTSTVNFTLPITGTHKLGASDADRNFATNIDYTCTF